MSALEVVRSAVSLGRFDLIELRDSQDLHGGPIDLGALAPDCEVLFVQPVGPPLEFRGIDGLIEGWRDWLEPWATYEVEVEELRDAGERVVSLATLRGETRHGGVELEQPVAAVITVAGGQMTRVEFHLDRRTALESAGIEG